MACCRVGPACWLLLVYISSFNPKDSFASFDKEDLIKLAKFYPKDFSITDLRRLSFQLANFIIDVRNDDRFRNLKNIIELSVLLVETNRHVKHSTSAAASCCNCKC